MDSASPKRAQSMKTIDKAMNLLNLFTTEAPEFRLVDIAKASGLDKVTAMRVLNSLVAGGLLEQHPDTRKYRLGTAILRLARIRETSFPMISTLQPIVDRLSEETGESGHASLASEAGLTTIALCEPNRSTRVWIDPTQVLPFHATASGIVYLAHLPPEEAGGLLARTSDKRYTAETASREELHARIREARKQGYACSIGGFEVDTAGFAAPVFDWHGKVIATMGLACVRSRLEDANHEHLIQAVVNAANTATRAFGGKLPEPNGAGA